MKKLTIAVAGYGLRGQCYTACAEENDAVVVAAAEPDAARLAMAREKFGLPPERCFASAEALLAEPRLADVLFLCTQDRQHVPMALRAVEKGYHLLLEKPISPVAAECLALADAAKKYDRTVTVCHVLRCDEAYRAIKGMIDAGRFGRVLHIDALMGVGYFHQAHSFVRGNWRRTEETSPMLLAKSCHDMDILYWLLGSRCRRVSSFGSLSFFRPESAPAGAGTRCVLDCACRDACPYDAEKIYVTSPETGVLATGGAWPCTALADHPDEESVRRAIAEGPYGRCVFHCDNDAVDHQTVAMEFENGATASFTMSAFTDRILRTIHVQGTLGELRCDLTAGYALCTPFGGETERIEFAHPAGVSGHDDADRAMAAEALRAVRERGTGRESVSSLDASVHSHMVALAAEESRRRGGGSVELAAFERACRG